MASQKKTTSNQQTTSNSSSTANNTSTSNPNVPDWLLDPAQKLAGNVGGFMDQGPGAYTPGVSDLQGKAFSGAGALSTSPLIGQAASKINGLNYTPSHVASSDVGGQSVLDGLDKYYTPFKDQVLNPVLTDFDVNAGKTRAAQAAQAAGTGAFRGSRYGIREAATEGELARGRAATEGGLLGDMFKTSAQLASEDANRRQGALVGNADRSLSAGTTNAGLDQASIGQQQAGAGLLSGFGQAQGAEDRATVGAQGLLGGQQTDLQNQIKQYPLEYQKQLEGLFAGLDPSMFTGQTVNSSGTTSGTSEGTSTGSQTQSGASMGDWLQLAAILGKK